MDKVEKERAVFRAWSERASTSAPAFVPDPCPACGARIEPDIGRTALLGSGVYHLFVCPSCRREEWQFSGITTVVVPDEPPPGPLDVRTGEVVGDPRLLAILDT